MNINAIRDAVKALAQSLQVTTVFPAGLFVLVNAYFVVPGIWPDFDLTLPSAVTIMISSTLMLSYTLYAFNFPLIRLWEGYKLQETDLLQWRLEQQLKGFNELTEEKIDLWAQFEECRDYFDSLESDSIPGDQEFLDYRKRLKHVRECLPRLERTLDIDYPSARSRVLPTKLGNTVAAFEDYPRTRYGMDPIALWSRLIPILKEQKYLEFVSSEKAVFDFLMNTCIITLIVGLELIFLNLFLGNWILVLLIAGLTIVLSGILYNGMTIAARQWGTTVRVAFDLYRHDLYQRMALRTTRSFKDERERWQAVSDFFLYRRERTWEDFNEFLSPSEVSKLKRSKKA